MSLKLEPWLIKQSQSTSKFARPPRHRRVKSPALVLCTRVPSSFGGADDLSSSRGRSWAAGWEDQNPGMLFWSCSKIILKSISIFTSFSRPKGFQNRPQIDQQSVSKSIFFACRFRINFGFAFGSFLDRFLSDFWLPKPFHLHSDAHFHT